MLSRMALRGYKSISECDLDLRNINVLIGANGAGKSNFISFFRLIQQLLDHKLQTYISKQGGPDAILHFGRKRTPSVAAELYFGNNGYKFSLEPTKDNKMVFAYEDFWWNLKGNWHIANGHFETESESQKSKTHIYKFTIPEMKSWCVYHFHDTSDTALVKQLHGINDNEYLR